MPPTPDDTKTDYPPTLGMRAVEIARTKIGEREHGGANKGPIVLWSTKDLTKAREGLKWCAFFAWQCFLQAAQTPEQRALVKGLASSSSSFTYSRLRSQKWHIKDPVPGCMIFFAQKGLIYHMGIVEKIEKGMVYVIEGNSGDSVKASRYPLDHATIYAYTEVRL